MTVTTIGLSRRNDEVRRFVASRLFAILLDGQRRHGSGSRTAAGKSTLLQ
jgi:hypothetical protein